MDRVSVFCLSPFKSNLGGDMLKMISLHTMSWSRSLSYYAPRARWFYFEFWFRLSIEMPSNLVMV